MGWLIWKNLVGNVTGIEANTEKATVKQKRIAVAQVDKMANTGLDKI
jgi:hypothetical protein